MEKTVFFIVLVAIYSGAIILIPRFLTEEAAARLIKHFRDNGATAFWSARTVGEMKLDSRNVTETGIDPRWDYRPIALKKLMEAGIIRKIGEDKLFLSEKRLSDYCRSEDRMNVCNIG